MNTKCDMVLKKMLIEYFEMKENFRNLLNCAIGSAEFENLNSLKKLILDKEKKILKYIK